MSKIWKKIEKIEFTNCSEVIEELKNKDYKMSPWIEDIFKKNNNKFNSYKFPINLVRIWVKDLGFNQPVELKEIHKKIKELNYKLVPPEIALYSRILYKDQPKGEWLRFATPFDSMIDSETFLTFQN